jgi:hypothetical protein
MRATVRDRSALQALSPDDVVTYLSAGGWTRVESGRQTVALFVHEVQGDHHEALVPLDQQLVDYATRISHLLGTLERVEGRSQLDILRDLRLAGVDVIRVQATEVDSRRGSIQLQTGAGLVERAAEMMAAAAAAAIAPRRVLPARRPNEAEEYLRKIELGQSERGSYVITVLSPVQAVVPGTTPPLLEMMDAPFPRQVTRTLSHALEAAKEATIAVAAGASPATFIEKVPAGLTANLCEAVAGMFEKESRGEAVSVKIAWASRLPESSGPVQVDFSSEDVPVLSEGARLLRQEEPEKGILITGVVINLHREEDELNGIATVACVIGGRVRKLFVPLGGNDYDAAIEAHRTQRPVLFSADVVRVGRQYQAENPRSFRLGD